MVTINRHIPSFILMLIATFLLSAYIIVAFTINLHLYKFESISFNLNIIGWVRVLILLTVYICFTIFFIIKSRRPVFTLSIGLLIIFLLSILNAFYLFIFVFDTSDGFNNYIQNVISVLFQTFTTFLTSSLFTIYSFGKNFKIPVIVFLIINIGMAVQSVLRYTTIYFSQLPLHICDILFYFSLLIFVILYKKPTFESPQQLSSDSIEYIYDISIKN